MSVGRPFPGTVQDAKNHDTRRFDSIHHNERSCRHHQLPGSRHTARPGTVRKVGKAGNRDFDCGAQINRCSWVAIGNVGKLFFERPRG